MEIVVPAAKPKRNPLSFIVIPAIIFACVAYAIVATRNFRSASLFLAGEVKRAQVLEPSDAEYPYVEGLQAMHEADPRAASSDYAEALRLNPRMPGAWLDYAYSLRALGKHNESMDALSHALSVAPSQPDVIFEAASARLAMGDPQGSFPLFRALLEHNTGHSPEIIELCWRALPDPDNLSSILLGANTSAYREFLEFLHRRNRTADAQAMFQDYLAAKAVYDPNIVAAHIDYLLGQHEVDAADAAWEAAAKHFPSLAQYRQTGNLVANAGFELDRMNGGFGWRVEERPSVIVRDDTGHVAKGDRSLIVIFDDAEGTDFGVSQQVPVQPAHAYTLSFTSMSPDLALEASPRIVVLDAFTREELGGSKSLGAADDWHTDTIHFTTGASTRLVELRLDRRPSNRRLNGKLWLDDFLLPPGN